MTTNIINSNAAKPSGSPAEDIELLLTQLRNSLAFYIICNPAAREAFVQRHGRSLLRLDALLHPLTRSPIEREHLIVAQSLFLDIERELVEHR